MMPIYNEKGQEVGFIKNKTYFTQRDNAKGQIFRAPKYQNGIGISEYPLKQILKQRVDKIEIVISNFEKISFVVYIEVNTFLKNCIKANFDKRNEFGQSYTGYGNVFICPLDCFRRKIFGQTSLDRFQKK